MSALAESANGTPVEADQASVWHGQTCALASASLRVRRGEFVGVIGPNGAGKTTLLRVLNGLTGLSSGRVKVLGTAPGGFSGYRLRRRIAYVAQIEQVDSRLPMTVFDTVLAGAYGRKGLLRRIGRREREQARAALAQVGMDHLRERPVGVLSGGEYQRVAIARALVQDPALFLFDEPTASIDPRAQEEILALVETVHREMGTTALYVTHDLSTLPGACERLVLMKDGAVWREGPRDSMLTPSVLEALYDGQPPVGEG